MSSKIISSFFNNETSSPFIKFEKSEIIFFNGAVKTLLFDGDKKIHQPYRLENTLYFLIVADLNDEPCWGEKHSYLHSISIGMSEFVALRILTVIISTMNLFMHKEESN